MHTRCPAEQREKWESEIAFLAVSWLHLLEKFSLRVSLNVDRSLLLENVSRLLSLGIDPSFHCLIKDSPQSAIFHSADRTPLRVPRNSIDYGTFVVWSRRMLMGEGGGGLFRVGIFLNANGSFWEKCRAGGISGTGSRVS